MTHLHVFIEVVWEIRGGHGHALESTCSSSKADLFCLLLRQLHFDVNLINDGGWLLLINGLNTDGRNFFWKKCNLAGSLVQFFKILWEFLWFFPGFEIQSFLFLHWYAMNIMFSIKTKDIRDGFHGLLDDCVCLLVLISRNY